MILYPITVKKYDLTKQVYVNKRIKRVQLIRLTIFFSIKEIDIFTLVTGEQIPN